MKTLELKEYQVELDTILVKERGQIKLMSAKNNGSKNVSV